MKKEFDLAKRFRFLIQMLILSGALNIALLCGIFYLVFLNGRSIADFAVKPVILHHKNKALTNSQFLTNLSSLSFREIIPVLSNKELMEEGHSKRDLALGYLISFHDFNIEKALPNQNLQKRTFFFFKEANKCEITVLAGLSDLDYENIIHYAMTDTWPLTSKGLFKLLKKAEKPRDATLEKAFMVSNEFYVISNLFQGLNLKPEEILELTTSSSWEFIENFVKQQNLALDLSSEKKIQFLLNALPNSPLAADLLLKVDFAFIAKRLSDDEILKILSLLKEQSKEAENFCILLLKSSRSDFVWRAAAAKLYEYAREKLPENLDQKEAMKRFVREEKIVKEEKPTLSTIVFGKDAPLYHIVKDGENLWKIARKYKVDVNDLIKLNKLENSRIYPGKKIVIPKK